MGEQSLMRDETGTRNGAKPPLVLVVDDYEDAREMCCEVLEFRGYATASARDGIEALEKARALKPALILMDLSIPGIDGWEATRRLKSDSSTREIPVVALTGHALNGHEERARSAGCDRFLTKPCLPDDLVAALAEVLGAQSKSPSQAPAPSRKKRKSR